MANQDELESLAGQIQEALRNERVEEARSLFIDLHPADQAEIFSWLEDEEQDQLLPLLNPADQADLLEELEDGEVLEAVEGLSSDQLADVLDEMEPDEAADLLGDLPPEQASAALARMEDAEEVRPLLGYPDETAGGLMTTWYIALRRKTTVQQAIEFLRQVHPDTDIPYYLYVVDRDRRLVGVAGLRDLVVSEPDLQIETFMDPEVIFVQVGTDQEQVAETMNRYELSSIPVVDEQQRLVGVIHYSDIVEVIEDEATEDILHLGAVESGPVIDKPYWDQKITSVVRSRFTWLITLFFAETFTGTVLRAYEGELKTVVALSFFVPLLIGTGGNAGSQTVATIIRGMALREVRPRDFLRVWWREFRTGSLLGLLIGSVAFGRALLWHVEPQLALTVAITVAAICVWANSVAALVPLAAVRLKIDPTLISGPLMTTLIDGTGLVIYFTLAALILPEL